MVFSKLTLAGSRAAILSSAPLPSAMVLRTVAMTSFDATSKCGRLITEWNLAAACWNAASRSGEDFCRAGQVATSRANINEKSRCFLAFIRRTCFLVLLGPTDCDWFRPGATHEGSCGPFLRLRRRNPYQQAPYCVVQRSYL